MRPVPQHTPEASLSGEFAFLERLRRALPEPPPGQVGVGDDTAVLDGGLLFATDVLTEGVHFDLRWATTADVGWKALAVNLSDLAAMGGSPRAAVCGVVLGAGRKGEADDLAAGLMAAATELGCPLVGGDTTVGAAKKTNGARHPSHSASPPASSGPQRCPKALAARWAPKTLGRISGE